MFNQTSLITGILILNLLAMRIAKDGVGETWTIVIRRARLFPMAKNRYLLNHYRGRNRADCAEHQLFNRGFNNKSKSMFQFLEILFIASDFRSDTNTDKTTRCPTTTPCSTTRRARPPTSHPRPQTSTKASSPPGPVAARAVSAT